MSRRVYENILLTLVVVVIMAVGFFLGTFLSEGRADGAVLHETWKHSANRYPYITVENHAHRFSVKQAVKQWGTPLHYGKCSAHPNSPCVHVYGRDWGPNGYAGAAKVVNAGSRIVRANVFMNRYYLRIGGYNVGLQGVQHELGHCMGLDHDNGSGVMRELVDGYHIYPSAYERREVYRIYH